MSRAGRQGDFWEAVVQSRRGTSICLLVSLLDRAEQHTLRTKDEMWVGHRSILLQMKELRPARQRFAHGQRASKGQCWVLTARLRARPPRLFTELDSNSSTSESGEAGGERRRGCRGECDLQILPQGRRQKLIPSLQDAKKAGRGL